jgi:hypothetical protein
MKKVSILIPYVRPNLIDKAVMHSVDNAGMDDFEIITKQDTEKIGHTKLLKQMVEESESEMVAFIHDDCIPHKNYLKNAVETMNQFEGGFGLVGFFDGLSRPFSTHWLAHRKLLPLLDGEFLHTGYKHCCCDVELAERCKAMNRYVVDNTAYVEHVNPILTEKDTVKQIQAIENDYSYRKAYNRNNLFDDRQLLQKRRLNNWK